jgi:hypothetical protein
MLMARILEGSLLMIVTLLASQLYMILEPVET